MKVQERASDYFARLMLAQKSLVQSLRQPVLEFKLQLACCLPIQDGVCDLLPDCF